MATSESDGDFESADEELERGTSIKKDNQMTARKPYSCTVDSESDDDTEYVQQTFYPTSLHNREKKREASRTDASPHVEMNSETAVNDKADKTDSNFKGESNVSIDEPVNCSQNISDQSENISSSIKPKKSSLPSKITVKEEDANSIIQNTNCNIVKLDDNAIETEDTKLAESPQNNQSHQLNMKKLEAKITESNVDTSVIDDITTKSQNKFLNSPNERSLDNKDTEYKLHENQLVDNQFKLPRIDDLSEMNMPEELKSNKKFKEVFQSEGWEGLDDDIQFDDELTTKKLQPVLEKLSLASKEPENSLGSWSNWGNWGVTSIINTATAGVSTLTNHVSQGFTLLEDTIGMPDTTESATKTKQTGVVTSNDIESSESQEQENKSYSPFDFGNIISGVTSITKLVELTSNKVMTGGLDTLEAIGKKTMEVLQDGDPGLKKKRAFLLNQMDKPLLSEILREAKENAENKEKMTQELTKTVYFECLFDDYQGLVHLEALEMLSKQSDMKIQQHLLELDTNESTSVQEMLEEIRELCDLSNDDNKGVKDEKELKDRLEAVCHDISVNITYEKLFDVWKETEDYFALSLTRTDREIFQSAMSTLARFTAFSIERFHKTAELLLIKERRSTVTEADALVQLTNVLSNQMNMLTDLFCEKLSLFTLTTNTSDNVNVNIMTVRTEANHADSYIQDAFRLFIPILQVGAI